MEKIIDSLVKTQSPLFDHIDYPNCPGIYAVGLRRNSLLNKHASTGQIIYVGISQISLSKRDLNQHFKSGKSGSSSLRRSLGAILKQDLSLTTIPRGRSNDKKRFTNYMFLEESNLTNWMIENLSLGYWKCEGHITKKELRKLEEQVILQLKPMLDLDARTKKNNPYSDTLSKLRKDCRIEARENENLLYL